MNKLRTASELHSLACGDARRRVMARRLAEEVLARARITRAAGLDRFEVVMPAPSSFGDFAPSRDQVRSALAESGLTDVTFRPAAYDRSGDVIAIDVPAFLDPGADEETDRLASAVAEVVDGCVVAAEAGYLTWQGHVMIDFTFNDDVCEALRLLGYHATHDTAFVTVDWMEVCEPEPYPLTVPRVS